MQMWISIHTRYLVFTIQASVIGWADAGVVISITDSTRRTESTMLAWVATAWVAQDGCR